MLYCCTSPGEGDGCVSSRKFLTHRKKEEKEEKDDDDV